jgi:hypothetical protein
MQGERDAKERLSAAYFDALSQLVENLRRDLKQPQMNFVIGRLSDFGQETNTHWQAVRKAQVDLAKCFLRNFRGYLHADAYAGYDAIFLGSGSKIVEVACWAHARRKFFDARKNYPREAHQMLEWIGQLYDIEDRGQRRRALACHQR